MFDFTTLDLVIYAISKSHPKSLEELDVENKEQSDYSQWIDKVHNQKGWSSYNAYLLFKNHISIHLASSFISRILIKYYSTPLGGTLGFNKIYHCIYASFFWPHTKSTILTFVSRCDIYQRNKVDTKALPSLIQPLHIL